MLKSPQFEASKKSKTFAALSLVAMAILIAVGISSFGRLRTEYSVMQFLPPHHPAVESDHTVRARFNLVDHPTYISPITLNADAKGTWLQKDRMAALQTLTDKIGAIEGVTKALSISNAEGVAVSDEDVNVGKLTELVPENKWAERFGNDALFSPGLITKDGRTAVIIIELRDADSKLLTDTEAKIKPLLQSAFVDAQAKVGGVPAVQTDLAALLGKELGNFLGLTILACAVTLLLVFKSWKTMFVPLLLTAFANIMVIAVMAWSGLEFTVLSSTVPILVFITVVSLAIHILLRLHEDAQHPLANETKWNLITRSGKAIWLPNLLGALTSCVGFLTLLAGDVPLIRNYGITVAVAVMVSWLLTSVAILPLLLLFPMPEPRSWVQRPARWALYVMNHRKVVVASVLTACLALALFGRHLQWTGRLFDDLPAGEEARDSTERIDHDMGGVIPFEVSLQLPENADWKDPARMNQLSELIKDLRKVQGVGTALGLPDFLMAGSMSKGSQLPATRKAMAEMFMLYAFLPENPLRQLKTDDERSTLVSLRLNDLPANQMLALSDTVVKKFQEKFPDAKVETAGMGAYTHLINNELSVDLIFGFWQALVIIVISLALIFRSLRWALTACLPNLVPPLALLGYLAFTHTPIKPGVAIIFSIALGLAFNNTVYLLNRMRELQKNRTRLPVTKTFYLEGNPCLVSTMIIMTGFSVFMFSYFPLNQTFGACMIVSILGGVVGDLIFLPALLRQWPALLGDKKVVAELGEALAPTPIIPVPLVSNVIAFPSRSPNDEVNEKKKAA